MGEGQACNVGTRQGSSQTKEGRCPNTPHPGGGGVREEQEVRPPTPDQAPMLNGMRSATVSPQAGWGGGGGGGGGSRVVLVIQRTEKQSPE